MARFHAKRHVVRDAIARLTSLGIVIKAPNRSASVRTFEIDEVEHIYQMREILQREAAKLIPLPGSPELVATLRKIQNEHSDAVRRGILRDVKRYNIAFHETLFRACGNPLLVDAIQQYSTLAHVIRSYRITDPTRLAQARDEHFEMIDALEHGDRKSLVRLCVEHILPSKIAYLKAHRSIKSEL